MNVTESHHIDTGEKDADGSYDYFYECDLYEFEEKQEKLIARSYFGENHAHFLRKEIRGKKESITQDDLHSNLGVQAIEFLKKKGFTEIQYLGDCGYESI